MQVPACPVRDESVAASVVHVGVDADVASVVWSAESSVKWCLYDTEHRSKNEVLGW